MPGGEEFQSYSAWLESTGCTASAALACDTFYVLSGGTGCWRRSERDWQME